MDGARPDEVCVEQSAVGKHTPSFEIEAKYSGPTEYDIVATYSSDDAPDAFVDKAKFPGAEVHFNGSEMEVNAHHLSDWEMPQVISNEWSFRPRPSLRFTSTEALQFLAIYMPNLQGSFQVQSYEDIEGLLERYKDITDWLQQQIVMSYQLGVYRYSTLDFFKDEVCQLLWFGIRNPDEQVSTFIQLRRNRVPSQRLYRECGNLLSLYCDIFLRYTACPNRIRIWRQEKADEVGLYQVTFSTLFQPVIGGISLRIAGIQKIDVAGPQARYAEALETRDIEKHLDMDQQNLENSFGENQSWVHSVLRKFRTRLFTLIQRRVPPTFSTANKRGCRDLYHYANASDLNGFKFEKLRDLGITKINHMRLIRFEVVRDFERHLEMDTLKNDPITVVYIYDGNFPIWRLYANKGDDESAEESFQLSRSLPSSNFFLPLSAHNVASNYLWTLNILLSNEESRKWAIANGILPLYVNESQRHERAPENPFMARKLREIQIKINRQWPRFRYEINNRRFTEPLQYYAFWFTVVLGVLAIIPAKRERLQALRSQHGSVALSSGVTVDSIVGGMRGLKCMVWEGSELDAYKGIRFHGMSITECQRKLPAANSGEMLPEAMFWLILTSEIPSAAQISSFSSTLAKYSELPKHTTDLLDSLPKSLHPMTQLSIAVSTLNHDSSFAKQYAAGLHKKDYWSPTFDDSINLLAKLPTIASRIYRNIYDAKDQGIDQHADWSMNFARGMGMGENSGMVDMIRLYLALHGDHEGGNVSAHTAHLVNSALADPYLSYASALNGLAGPLHGLAAQEVLVWVLKMQKEIGDDASEEAIEKYLWKTLNSGQVVPGYGHGVLRNPDPRFTALQDFAKRTKGCSDDPLVKLVIKNSQVATKVMKEHGKAKNPFPNVDATSGVLLNHFGMQQTNFYTVVFGVSRAIGCLAQLVWDRALGLPIERPKSMSIEAIFKAIEEKQ
ncbi:2-methylcitrate synthase, mitochondrial [Neolecta irregularis DAH-3]|uniref:Citrate synthase n=1 Tax=Neolecta irregularis (strain DAH-3) TaxID=1198029 RepID=A0A1U7LPP6_NEOID|nr:2-methylcitrate synthase, mitochondrial [Neolecta irregularis DAH-3]|eukprot:OLL24627.1 2-methylcitrate synthase, mitochondrial [Neolecta irregularis DAH-3]